jgi:hypothetical protein
MIYRNRKARVNAAKAKKFAQMEIVHSAGSGILEFILG